jgi:hypothetical protein
MRRLPLIVVLFAVGCAQEADNAGGSAAPPAIYDPATFREEITRLIEAKRYEDAVLLVTAADVNRQAAHDADGYLAVGEDLIALPGAESEYDPERDWCFPGTQDAIEHAGWQDAATEFAKRYNLRRAAIAE